MAPLNRRLTIAGCGPGARCYVTRAVEQAIAEAKVLAGARTLLDRFGEVEATRLVLERTTDDWLDRVAACPDEPIVVLVSGDPGISSLSARVLSRFGRDHCRVLPGVSSVQLACARLGLSWENAAIITAHASLPERLPTALSERDPWVVLLGARGAEAFAAELGAIEERFCYVGEDLSLPTERMERTSLRELAQLPVHPRRIAVLTREALHE